MVSRPIVGQVNALSFVLLVLVAALLVSQIATRRRLTAAERAAGAELARAAPSAADSVVAAAAAKAPIGIVVRDKAGDLVFQNDVAADYLASTVDSAVLAMRLRSLLDEAHGFDEDIEQQVELFSPSPRTIQLQAVPLFTHGERVGTVGFIEDLTTRSQIDSIRSDFIANASHELKTPLGAMRLLAEALVATDDPEVQRDVAAKISSEASRMNRLVEDILDLAEIESSSSQPEDIDLSEVATVAVAKSRSLAEALGITVRVSVESVRVAGDRGQLTSAVANIVENALNYTAAKGMPDPLPVDLRIWEEPGRAIVEVKDHGIGIPERHQERIFERFYRVDRGRSRASGGTGLGLAIVRNVVKNHAGEVEIESVPGEGSTFRIVLPTQEK